MMVVSTDQWRAKIGSFSWHRLCLSKFKWNNNQIFLKIIFIYFLLMCNVLNTTFCFSNLATRLMFHWKAVFILPLFVYLFICSLLLLHGDIESNPGPRNSKNHLPSFETYLDSSLPSVHVWLELEGYKLVRADQPDIKSLSLSQSNQWRIWKLFNKLWTSPIWHQRPQTISFCHIRWF